MRGVIDTIIGIALLYAAVVGVGYIVEAKQARERASATAHR